MNPAAPPRGLDTAPLTSPLPRSAIAAYRAAVRASGRLTAGGMIQTIVTVAALVLIGGFVLTALGLAAAANGTAPVLPVVVAIAFAGVLALIVVGRLRSLFPWRRWAQLDAFARANDMTFTPRTDGSDENGLIFGRGDDRITRERVALGAGWLDGRAAVGTYSYSVTTGSGKDRHTTTYPWTYLVIRLDRTLPAMVLDAVQNDRGLFRGSDLPERFDSSQRLKLEGDFDRYFRLFAPTGYETDALTVFTPDLMQLLIEHAGSGTAFDVEIIDDRVYFYTPEFLDLLLPAVWQRLAGIVQLVGAKTLRQTTRYADDRVGDRALNLVAPGGRRLRPSTNVGLAVGVLVIAVVGVVSLFALR